MTKEESEMLMLMNHPFARPLLHAPRRAVRCTYRPQPFILCNMILTLEFHIVLARSCGGITAHFLCQMKEDELNFVTMKIIFHKLFNFSGKIAALSGFLFIRPKGCIIVWRPSVR